MNLTPLFNAVIALMSVIITVYLIPFIKSKYSTEKINNAYAYVTIAVKAAEQLMKDTKTGQEKREWVLQYLHNAGIDVDWSTIDALIEEAVYELNKQA